MIFHSSCPGFSHHPPSNKFSFLKNRSRDSPSAKHPVSFLQWLRLIQRLLARHRRLLRSIVFPVPRSFVQAARLQNFGSVGVGAVWLPQSTSSEMLFQ